MTSSSLAGRCGVRPGLRVLMVGCGIGQAAAHLAPTAGCEVVVSDRRPAVLDWTRRHVAERGVVDRVEVMQADVRGLPWDGDAFDVVICESVLVWVADKAGALTEMVRVARTGGIVGLDEGTLFGDDIPDAVDMYARDALGGAVSERAMAWDGLLRGAGLDRVSAERHPFRTSDEVRTTIRWIGVRKYVAVLVRLARLYRDEQDLRDLLRGDKSTPRHVTGHMGAGVHVGEVPVAA